MRRYSFAVLFHVAGIILMSVGTYLLVEGRMWFCAVTLFLLLLATAVHLYRLQMVQMRMMRSLAESLRHDDMMVSFRSPYRNRPMEEMAGELSEAMQGFRTRVLERNEMDAWQKLIRVLTHEIMNSIAPISSLSETFMHRDDVRQSSLYEGIRAIHDTSAGLISFVDSYRKFSSLQKPSPEPFYVKELTAQIENLHLIPPHIAFTQLIEPSDLMLYADPNLIRQVLINLIKNAVQAIGPESGRIHIRAYSSADEHVFIYVSNNGPSIPETEAEEIFVPFFTTKKDGSGIGLSLSRQIMKLSGGTITLLRAGTNGWNTTFVLEFE